MDNTTKQMNDSNARKTKSNRSSGSASYVDTDQRLQGYAQGYGFGIMIVGLCLDKVYETECPKRFLQMVCFNRTVKTLAHPFVFDQLQQKSNDLAQKILKHSKGQKNSKQDDFDKNFLLGVDTALNNAMVCSVIEHYYQQPDADKKSKYNFDPKQCMVSFSTKGHTVTQNDSKKTDVTYGLKQLIDCDGELIGTPKIRVAFGIPKLWVERKIHMPCDRCGYTVNCHCFSTSLDGSMFGDGIFHLNSRCCKVCGVFDIGINQGTDYRCDDCYNGKAILVQELEKQRIGTIKHGEKCLYCFQSLESNRPGLKVCSGVCQAALFNL